MEQIQDFPGSFQLYDELSRYRSDLFTGRIELVGGEGSLWLEFVEGGPVRASSTNLRFSVQALMLRKGLISQEQAARVLSMAAAEGLTFCQYLEKKGEFSSKELDLFSRQVSREILIEAFSGDYLLASARYEPVERVDRVFLDLDDSMFRALAACPRERLPDFPEELIDSLFAPTPKFGRLLLQFRATFPHMDLPELIRSGPMTPRELLEGREQRGDALKSLYAMIHAGMIHPLGAAARDPQAPVLPNITAPLRQDTRPVPEIMSPAVPQAPVAQAATIDLGDDPIEDLLNLDSAGLNEDVIGAAPGRSSSLALEVEQELSNHLETMVKTGYYGILEVTPYDSLARIRRQHHKFMERFSREAYPQSVTMETTEQLLTRIRQSYDAALTILTSRTERHLYDQSLRIRYAEGHEKHYSKVFDSDEAYQQARRRMQMDHWVEARKLLNRAIELNPEETEYRAQRAWCMFQATISEQIPEETPVDEIKISLRRILEKDDKCELAYLYLARMELYTGDREEASMLYSLLSSLNRDHADANLDLDEITTERNLNQKKSVFKRVIKLLTRDGRDDR